MQLLEDRIRKDGKVREGNVLKVDSFLNHQMDVNLFREIGKEFQRRFAGEEITKILTIEASGIGIACVVAEIFNVPVVFAKKTQTKNIAGDVYTTKVDARPLPASRPARREGTWPHRSGCNTSGRQDTAYRPSS